MSKKSNLLKVLGPGIMFAGTCIGGSHLMQSTKAGAFFGFGLLVVVLVANLVKYPFFEFASRYTNATGDSILEGYKKRGQWTLILYGVTTIFSMFIINAAIGALASGLTNNLFTSLTGITIDTKLWPIILFSIVFIILAYGKFGILDKILKVVGIILVLTVGAAFFSIIGKPLKAPSMTTWQVVSSLSGFKFAIVLMGWMPMGVDMSAWHSLWTQERIKQTNYHPTLKETLLDFNIGYVITVVLAIFFLSIGAIILYNHPIYTIASIKNMGGLAYSKTLVDMFTEAVGPWSFYIILIAAFATMFGTAITLADGYCRSVIRTLRLLRNQSTDGSSKRPFLICLVILMIGSYITLIVSGENLGKIINLATGTSFVIAPIAAYLNYKIIFNPEVPESHKPSKSLNILAITGIIFLSVFTVVYLVILFK